MLVVLGLAAWYAKHGGRGPGKGLDQDFEIEGGSRTFLNPPGRWKYFLSHVQKEAGKEALDAFGELGGAGKVWLDVKMVQKSTEAMVEGVRNSQVFVLILTPEYLNREFCVLELRTAQEHNKTFVVVHPSSVKRQLGELFRQATAMDIGDLGKEEAIELVITDPEHAKVTDKKFKAAAAARFKRAAKQQGPGLPDGLGELGEADGT